MPIWHAPYTRPLAVMKRLKKKLLIKFHGIIVFFLTSLILSCNSNESSMNTPEFFQPNWQEINLAEFRFKFGDKIQFEVEKQTRKGVVVDFSEDEGGKWIGICFMNRENLFGRQIPSGFTNNCVDLLDISYLNENGFDEIEIIGKYEINKKKIGIGSMSPTSNKEELERDYQRGIEQRRKEQTECRKSVYMQNPVNECYFQINKILK